MPYSAGRYLPGERASKLGHLEVLKSALVQKLVKSYEELGGFDPINESMWLSPSFEGEPLELVFAVDGSIQIIEDAFPPYKALAFVKTALMRMDEDALGRIDKNTPHPFALRDLMMHAALYHATVFPLRHVRVPGLSVYNAIRESIYESIKDDSLSGEPMETLKWIAYEKWTGKEKSLEEFECPHCGSKHATLAFDREKGSCSSCNGELLITDMLGFHLEMAEDAASDSVATAYMNIHETLLLFTGIKHFWENDRETLKKSLFIKDGPLQIRAQYSKLVSPIRRFFLHALKEGISINVIGQEKTGAFVDHLNLIGRGVSPDRIFIPDHNYICEQIQHRPIGGDPYGKDTNYGAKVFLSIKERYKFVLSMPVSVDMKSFVLHPEVDQLIGLPRILATLPRFLSSRFENALLPIELANSIASLSTYPSAQVLRIFSDRNIGGD